MKTLVRYLGLVRPAATEFSLCNDQNRTRLGIDEKLGQGTLPQLVDVLQYQCHYVRLLTSYLELARPVQRDLPVGLSDERSAVLRHLIFAELAQN